MYPWAPLGCDSFSDFSWFWWPWEFWGVLAQVFCRMSFYWNFSDVFLINKLSLWIFRRKTTDGKFHFHSIIIKSTFYLHDLWLLMLIFITWLKQCFLGFFPVKSLFFPPFYIVYSLEESHYSKSIQKEWGVMLPLF